MQRKEFVIQNKTGLHARPATVFVQTANRFNSNIVIQRDGKKVSARSILGVLSLGAERDSSIIVEVDGSDEESAMKSIEELIGNKFGDKE